MIIKINNLRLKRSKKRLDAEAITCIKHHSVSLRSLSNFLVRLKSSFWRPSLRISWPAQIYREALTRWILKFAFLCISLTSLVHLAGTSAETCRHCKLCKLGVQTWMPPNMLDIAWLCLKRLRAAAEFIRMLWYDLGVMLSLKMTSNATNYDAFYSSVCFCIVLWQANRQRNAFNLIGLSLSNASGQKFWECQEMWVLRELWIAVIVRIYTVPIQVYIQYAYVYTQYSHVKWSSAGTSVVTTGLWLAGWATTLKVYLRKPTSRAVCL